jgi:tRNA(Ile)-lysidine synthase
MMKDNLFQIAKATVVEQNMLQKGDKVLAAVSGGADSMAMLWFLCGMREEWNLTLTAAHINHGLRGEEAIADQRLVEKICEQWQVPLFVHQADIRSLCRQTGEGEEECGRRVRYAFLEEKAKGGLIATAHTANDNAETVLMHLIDGSGLSGLCGIPPKRGNIIRPLIDCSRQLVEDCCRENEIPFATDATNADDRYFRNSVRHHLIPFCMGKNPAFLAGVSRMTTANRRDTAFLQQAGTALLEESRGKEGYRLCVLQQAEDAPLYYALKILLEGGCHGRIAGVHIEDVVTLVRKGTGKCSLPRQVTAICSAGWLRLENNGQQEETPLWLSVDAYGGVYEVKNKTVTITRKEKVHDLLTYPALDCDKIVGQMILRTRQAGDKITLKNRPAKLLKKLFIDEKIPVWEREKRWILADQKGILWVEGVGLDARCLPDLNTENVLEIHVDNGGKTNA